MLRQVMGGEASTGAAFDRVDRALRKAVDHKQDEFGRAAGRARDVLEGVNHRPAEYR
ncbi:hypothetical protein M4914_07185 [Streptomyces somaliensis DSM 40738]|uniref:Uncharacterized protein n=1 Tax=Streptomyces somaliensis (strain ATCC 33201 / DSM 40738 / JCM 12659 / KCTC 9044 / NCTC 11332 / NRRL B-12077 / IP 733) TaxID=1134445 RepID=A0AA44DC10_STRE0|nr:hypothetical protein [Streptomyces somaliensis]MCQ0022757.1 hypothetical protein [Streptomyces somaliensis DSM 40738]NKY13952.1 hypothetical protein [Streptomyces somaliensis DSM 40738]